MTTRELIQRLRANFIIENEKDDDTIHAFDIAVNETLLEIVDGQPAEPPKKKRGGRPKGSANKKSEGDTGNPPNGE